MARLQGYRQTRFLGGVTLMDSIATPTTTDSASMVSVAKPQPPATLYTFAATSAASFRPLFGDLDQFDMQVGEGVDASRYSVVAVDYPGAHLAWDGAGTQVFEPGYTILSGCQEGMQTCASYIMSIPGPFAFAAYSLGSVVAALVFQDLVSGSLQSRASDFLGAVTFGNSVRQQGHTIPGGTDPGGMGCFGPNYCMTSVPAKWWDFVDVDPLDPFTTVDATTTAGQDFIAAADAVLTASDSTAVGDIVAILQQILPNLSAQIPAIWQDLSEMFFPFLSPGDNDSGHGNYAQPYGGLPNNNLPAVELAVNYLNGLIAPNYQATPAVASAAANPMAVYRTLRALQQQPTPVSGTMNLPMDTL